MRSNFWKKLKKPIMVTAPMSGVSNEAFRLILLKHGRPDVFWTEFVPVNGLFSKGKKAFIRTLKFKEAERPIVAQVFGTGPVLFEKAAKIIKDMKFDGLDINMGCPDRDVEKQGAGAALIKNPDLARQIIKAAKKGAGNMPVSVKTRIGYEKEQIKEWIQVLLKEKIDVLIVHFRTRNEKYKPLAHWELAPKIVKLRNNLSPKTLIIGNGDVKSLKEAHVLAEKTGLDGIMTGRGVLDNPWFFSEKSPLIKERLLAVINHAKVFVKLNKNGNFNNVKKYFKGYLSDFSGARSLRDSLMRVKSITELEEVINDFKNKYKE
jgi:nifR3 family TIM-barrel protein